MNNQLVIASNDRNPIKEQFIRSLHQAALHCQLGYMDGMDPDTGEITPLLVGVEYNEEGKPTKLWPLGTVFLNADNLKNYLVPDGNGHYFNQNHDERQLDANGDPIAVELEEEGPAVESTDSGKGRRRKVGATDDRGVSEGSV